MSPKRAHFVSPSHQTKSEKCRRFCRSMMATTSCLTGPNVSPCRWTKYSILGIRNFTMNFVYAALGLILHRTHGHNLGVYPVLLAGVVIASCFVPRRGTTPRWLMASIVFLFALRLHHDPDLENVVAGSNALQGIVLLLPI